MQMFALYVGTNKPGAGDQIVRLMSRHFPSFTVLEGQGFFRGKSEPVWLVKIATDNCEHLIETAVHIREALDQEGIGIEYEGRYYRCTQDDHATALREAFHR